MLTAWDWIGLGVIAVCFLTSLTIILLSAHRQFYRDVPLFSAKEVLEIEDRLAKIDRKLDTLLHLETQAVHKLDTQMMHPETKPDPR